MTTKEKRMEIYNFLNQEFGELSQHTQIGLSKLLKEYAKIHSEILVETNILLTKQLEKLNKQKTQPTQPIRTFKPIKTKTSDTIRVWRAEE